MRGGLKDLRHRIQATRKIRQIAQALERASAARLVRARAALEAGRPYSERAIELFTELFSAPSLPPLAAFRPTAGRRPLVVAFGSDRGLCGGYHGELVSRATAFVTEDPARAVSFLTVGKVLYDRLRRLGHKVTTHISQPRWEDREAAMNELAAQAADEFASGKCDAVHTLYTRFVSAVRREPTLAPVLPAAQPPGTVEAARHASAAFGRAAFEPDPESLLPGLVSESVRVRIHWAFLNAVASEHAARSTAMNRASENAGEMIDTLSGLYNRVRQDNITNEMIEISEGVSA